MIVKYISELLFDHECVIIPEFGAFISKETPAMLDYTTHRLTPPSKEVAFNGQLVTDDGLLIGYVAQKQGVTMTEAAKMVHDFASRSLVVIESSGVLRLDGLGVLTRINERDYFFQIDENMNLFGDAFGLTSLTVQPIFRRETYQQIATQIETAQKERENYPHHVNANNYKWFRAAAYSMMVAFALVILGWGANKSDSRLASWNPLFYSSPNEFIVKLLNNDAVTREFTSVATLQPINVTVPICKEEVNYLQPLDIELLKPVNIDSYYIIGASLRSEVEAAKCAKRFQKLGFEGAVALPMNEKGNVRVAYELVAGKDTALKRLEIIKKDHNEAAWLLRKK